jgi:predicted nucleic acid-binding protein
MIDATALARELPVYTCNPDDFGKADDLIVVPVAVPPAI